MQNSRLVIWESAASLLRLSISSIYESSTGNGTRNNIYNSSYTNQAGQTVEVGNYRPSVALVLSYLVSQEGRTGFSTKMNGHSTELFVSQNNMYRVREIFRDAIKLLHDPSAFVIADGDAHVSVDFEYPVVAENIGPKNNWISLQLTVGHNDNNMGWYKAIAIQTSQMEGLSSIVPEPEFENMFDLIEHIDLAGQMSHAVEIELLDRLLKSKGGNYNGGYQQQSRPNGGYQHQGGYQRQSNYSQNNVHANYQQSAPSYGRPQQATPNVNPAPARSSYQQPQQQAAIPAQPKPRPDDSQAASKPMVSYNNLKDIPVSEASLDDSSAIDDVFGEFNGL